MQEVRRCGSLFFYFISETATSWCGSLLCEKICPKAESS
jgi:hypothetical protein